MRFDGWNTMEGRHLVFAYAATALIQASYFVWLAFQWRRLGTEALDASKKAAKP